MNVYFLLALFILLPYVIYGETIGCGNEWKEFQGNCYREQKLCSVVLVEECKAVGGNPVSIHSKEENDFVAKEVCGSVTTSCCWIGMHGRERIPGREDPNADHSKWIDGTPRDFSPPFFRSGGGGYHRQSCVAITGAPERNAGWSDNDSVDSEQTICKKPAGPVADANPTSANPAPSMPDPPKPNPTKRPCHKRRRYHHRHHKHH